MAMVKLHRWETATRYYMAWMQADLFGNLELATAWGGKFNRLGGLRFRPVANVREGLDEIARLGERRRRRCYVPLD